MVSDSHEAQLCRVISDPCNVRVTFLAFFGKFFQKNADTTFDVALQNVSER
jgi:hypothetical protein